MISYTDDQQGIIDAGQGDRTFLSGKAGTGKTTAGVGRLRTLLKGGVPPHEVMLLVPQRTLAAPYTDMLADPELGAGAQINLLTLGGLARRAVDSFWPLVGQAAGFAHPDRRPTFLTLETAQYFMARVVGDMIDRESYFDTATIDRPRLYSQLIDNLNKAAVIDNIAYTEISERLKSAWNGEREQLRMYDDVQTCVNAFRQYCLENNLLDFSLQVEVFIKHLWPLDVVQRWVFNQACHIIIDNVEEDTPVAHQVMAALVRQAETALVIYDEDAGYRQFLGADDEYAFLTLSRTCDRHPIFTETFVTGEPIAAFGAALAASQGFDAPDYDADPRDAITYDDHQYYPEVLDSVTERVGAMVAEGVPPGEIVVLAPYMSDALRFSLMNRLVERDVPVRSHRPSRALRDEPASIALLTLARLAHPGWGSRPATFDVVTMLMETIAEIDLVRARLLAEGVYREEGGKPNLLPFDHLTAETQKRVTYVFGERYEALRGWLADYQVGEPAALDVFFKRAFGECLSQPGFGFHSDGVLNRDSAEIAATLSESARKFRLMLEDSQLTPPDKTVAQEYVAMIDAGVLASQYVSSWQTDEADAVLVAPAFTFLMRNRPVDYQFWLNVGERGWSERLYQPLTNPYVLARNWPAGRVWTELDEVEASRQQLYRLTQGLIRRCRYGIYLGFSELGEQGTDQRGDLLMTVQRMLRRLAE